MNFFFDGEYMMKCCVNASSSNVEKCAGVAYFKLIQEFFENHYYLYDNGCEGIRNGCSEKGGKMCKFHRNVEDQEHLTDGWRSKPLKRLPLPVPDYSRKDGFHYCKLKDVYISNVTEKFSVKKDLAGDATKRERDDFCPRKQLDNLLLTRGEPDIVVKETVQDDNSVSISCADNNNTLGKALTNLQG